LIANQAINSSSQLMVLLTNHQSLDVCVQYQAVLAYAQMPKHAPGFFFPGKPVGLSFTGPYCFVASISSGFKVVRLGPFPDLTFTTNNPFSWWYFFMSCLSVDLLHPTANLQAYRSPLELQP
jgi:hypothetical protein